MLRAVFIFDKEYMCSCLQIAYANKIDTAAFHEGVPLCYTQCIEKKPSFLMFSLAVTQTDLLELELSWIFVCLSVLFRTSLVLAAQVADWHETS